MRNYVLQIAGTAWLFAALKLRRSLSSSSRSLFGNDNVHYHSLSWLATANWAFGDHLSEMPTTRPSDFPEADSWPASMRVCPGTEPAVLGITYEMAISRYVSEGLVAEWLEILLAPASADPD